MIHKTSPQRYSNIFSAFQFLFPPLTPDLPLPSSPQSDVKLICQMSSRLYILAHRFPTISTSLPHYLNLCFQQKKHYFFPFHDTCTFRTDRGLQFVEEVSKLQTEQFIRFVSPLPYNLWDDGLLLGIAEHSSWTLKQSSSLRQLRWNSTQTISKTIRLGLRVALTRVVSQ